MKLLAADLLNLRNLLNNCICCNYTFEIIALVIYVKLYYANCDRETRAKSLGLLEWNINNFRVT
jgi:hypothetical protein